MTVISGAGITGIIKVAYRNSSLVELATDPGFLIGARVAGSQEIGIVSGQGTQKGFLQLLGNETTLKVGDVILARGSKNNRPFVPGVPIGKVISVAGAAGALTQTGEIEFYANAAELSIVSVVVKPPQSDPRDLLVPAVPTPVPVPTVTIYATPSESPTP